MSTKRMIHETYGIFFITITCYKWIPLIQITNTYDAVYKWFNYLKEKGYENYLHSSRKFYYIGEQEIFPFTHIQELMAIDLTQST